MNKNTIMWIAAGVGAYLLVKHLRKSGGVSGLGVVIPPCRKCPSYSYDESKRQEYRAKGDRFKDAGYAELAKKYYALADQSAKSTSGCCKPGESPEERRKEWAEKREKYRMTPEELEKGKDQIEISYEKVRQMYQKSIDEGRSYHGMTPKQLKKWIADIPKKIAEKVKELERNPYKQQYELLSGKPAISPMLRATPASSLDFGIDQKPGQERPPRSWDPYKPTPTPPEIDPSEKPTIETGDLHMEMPKVTPKPGCGTICTSAVGHNTCVNTCTGERYQTDGKDRKITPASPASPATPSVRPAISPTLKATTAKAALRGLGCIGLDCF